MLTKSQQDRLDRISTPFSKWCNATKNVRTEPLRTFSPENKEDVLWIIQDAREKGITVRPVGAGHSFSEAAREDYYLISPLALDQVQKYEKAIRPNSLPDQKHLVRVQAGIRIKSLNPALYDMGYALDNMGAFDWQTISGAISTGTHGTGIHRPAIHDMVRSVIIILSNGETLQIESSQGITDPVQFGHDGGIKLVQDDDLFYSVMVSLGNMGFIYEYVLEVSDAFWLAETRKVMTWDDELKPLILSGEFEKEWIQKFEFVSFRINPYYTINKTTGKKERLCVVSKQWIHDDKRIPHGEARNLFFTFLGNLGFTMWILVWRLNNKLSRIPESINTAIKDSKDRRFVNRSYKLLYQSGLSIRREGISSEFAFDLNYHHLVELLDKLGDHFAHLRDDYGLYLSSHLPVRFVPQSKAYLSQCHTGSKMYIDVPTLDGVHGAEQVLDRNQKFVLDTLREYNGIIHWGKVNYHLYSRHDIIESHYPMLPVWKRVREQLDPIGMFHSYFAKKMGL